MKPTFLLFLALALPAIAGTTSSKSVIEPTPPADIWTWFAGGSVGYLFDYEEPIYSLHAGVDTPWQVAGWNVALFAEIAYTEPDDSTTILDPSQTFPTGVDLDSELEIIPLTANIKFERQLGSGFSAYVGAGVGVAFVDIDLHADLGIGPDLDESDSDTVFAAQVFAGVVYNFTEQAELYTGLKWLYLDDADNFDLGDDFAAELGFRWNF